MDDGALRLRELIDSASCIVAFTGAGLSAESGIPTYRGTGGLWTKYDPDVYASIEHFRRDPTYYWNFFRDVRYPLVSKAAPNPAHDALVTLERRGMLRTVVTQNIDGLHRMAGQRNVIELHGNTRRIMCMSCGREHTMDDAFARLRSEMPPTCDCGGGLRPDVVFFGEPLPAGAMEDAGEAARGCDLMLVVGSSLVVHPAALVPRMAVENGATLAIVNIDPTPMDGLAELVLNQSAVEVLREAVGR